MLSCINNLKVNFRYLLNTINDGSAVFSRGTLKEEHAGRLPGAACGMVPKHLSSTLLVLLQHWM